jgi:hypothetical protein
LDICATLDRSRNIAAILERSRNNGACNSENGHDAHDFVEDLHFSVLRLDFQDSSRSYEKNVGCGYTSWNGEQRG